MNSTFTTIFQAIAFGLQSANWGLVPAKYQPWVMLCLSIIQGIQAWIAHHYTPEGLKIVPGVKAESTEVVSGPGGMTATQTEKTTTETASPPKP